MGNNISLEDWEAEQLHDPEFKTAADALEPEYQWALTEIELEILAQEPKLPEPVAYWPLEEV